MKTKFFFAVLIIAVIATACTPKITENSESTSNTVQSAENALVPVTGETTSVGRREAQESRLWSGEIYLSDNSNPDHLQNAVSVASEAPPTECMSEDSQPRPYSGCVE